jgi:hypothetical protein
MHDRRRRCMDDARRPRAAAVGAPGLGHRLGITGAIDRAGRCARGRPLSTERRRSHADPQRARRSACTPTTTS